VIFVSITKQETAHHILWDCPSSTDVWWVCGRKIRKSCVVGRSFADVLEYMIERCTPKEVELHADCRGGTQTLVSTQCCGSRWGDHSSECFASFDLHLYQ
jgi:hypothetical protein